MRTSRIARETAKIVTAMDYTPRRSDRYARYANGKTPAQIKSEERSDGDGSTVDSATSARKRKRTTTITKFEYEHKVEIKTASASTSPAKPKNHRQAAKRIKAEDGSFTVSPPKDWERVYDLTKEMRSPGSRGIAYPAVVDTMGCERLADRKVSPRDQRFQTLIALMLSSQTKDTVTAAAMKNLQDKLPGGLCLESILQVDPVELDSLIGKVGFHNNKTRFIKQAAMDIRDKFNGEIPDTIEGLTSLAGVGPKMGYLTLSAAWGRTEGIGVDVHVHRITNLWGWHKTKTPEETRAMLEGWLPRDKWHEINHLLVGFGQALCLPVGRKCGDCLLADEALCPGSTVRRKVKKEAEVKIEDKDGGIGVVKVKKEEVEMKEESDISDTIEDIEDLGTRRRRPKR